MCTYSIILTLQCATGEVNLITAKNWFIRLLVCRWHSVNHLFELVIRKNHERRSSTGEGHTFCCIEKWTSYLMKSVLFWLVFSLCLTYHTLVMILAFLSIKYSWSSVACSNLFKAAGLLRRGVGDRLKWNKSRGQQVRPWVSHVPVAWMSERTVVIRAASSVLEIML